MTALLCLALAAQFWETKPPSTWTDEEIQRLLTDSPWAQQALGPRNDDPAVQLYLATARPIRQAEEQIALRARPAPTGEEQPEPEDEYRGFLRDSPGRYIVLAVALPAIQDPREIKLLEERCVLRIGRSRFKLAGHFPPSGADPWLRLVFPRAVTARDRAFRFDLYLPGIASPLRRVEFTVRSLFYQGTLEM